MAKDAYDAFLAECVAKVPEGKRAQVEEMLKDSEIAPAIRDRVLARSEFSRSMDQLRSERSEFEKTVAEANRNIEGWKDWYGNASTEFASTQERLRAYEETYGVLEGGAKPRFVTEEAVTKRLSDELANRDRLAIQFADMLTDLKLEHRQKYNERLNTEELIEFATKRGQRLTDAYRDFTADKAREIDDKAMEEKLKKAREEGAREYATQHKLPVAPVSMEPHPLDRSREVPKDSRDRVSAAVAAWNTRTT